jgi:UDP-N-acetylmuramoyl-tripeptide--D-alanyl-D-alanine ligase
MSGITLGRLIEYLRAGECLVAEPETIGAPTANQIGRVCSDSRLAQPGALFVAIEGARVDGHEFVDEAGGNGAIAALISGEKLQRLRAVVYSSITLLPVEDPLAAMQHVARQWRATVPELVRIGVTGSNGKTTTKEMIAAILSRVAPTVRSAGNFNSEIGLPMELMKIRSEHRFGVFEMGINRIGEMALLAELVDPTIALVTNIGSAHIGMFGSREALIEEKRSVFSRFTGSQTAVIPDDPEVSDLLVPSAPGTVIRYNRETAGVEVVELRGFDGTMLRIGGREVLLPLPGKQMVENAYAAITVCRALGADDAQISSGLTSLTPVAGRAEVIQGAVTVIQDAYNANPESVRASLDLLAETAGEGRRIAVIGAMKELGEFSDEAHRLVSAYAGSIGLDEVWLIGEEFASAAVESSGPTRIFLDHEWADLEAALGALKQGDTVLLKGSRSLALERLLPAIRGVAV